MADYGHEKTDKMLKQLERRIHSEYSNAAREIQKKTRDYLKTFEKRDSEMLAKLNANEITQKEYLTWRATTMATGQRWEALKNTIGAELENSNAIANAMIQGHTYDVYALNHNFGAYEVEKGSLMDTSYVLYDRSTVERLVKDNPKMLPKPGKRTSEKIKRGELKRWNNREVQSVMMQSILMGDSIPDIAKRLAEKVGEANSYSHIRAARTMTTGAENAGRLDSYKRAEEMGITMRKKWMATNDDRTREAHSELDGVSVPVDEPFENEIGEIMFPGDPDADDANVYNCRCTLIADFSSEDEEGQNPELADESFEEWSEAHEAQETEGESYYQPIDAETLVGETLTEEDVALINARWESLDKEWHANVSGVTTMLARDQEQYDSWFKNRMEFELQKNPKMRRATAEKKVVELLGTRPTKTSITAASGDFNFDTRLITLNTRSIAVQGGITEDISKREEFFERQKRRIAEGRKERTLGNVGQSNESIFTHEYGHAVDAQYRISEDERWLKFCKSYSREQISRGVSDYAATDEKELLAEIFCESYMGHTQRDISKKGMKVIREIMRSR